MFCASESSTAICRSTTSTNNSTTITLTRSDRSIDRHNPIINPSRRSLSSTSSSYSLTDQKRQSSVSNLVDVVRKSSSCIKPSAYFSPPPPSKPPHLLLAKTQSDTFECDKVAINDMKAGDAKLLVRCSTLKIKNDALSSDKCYYSPFRVLSHQVVAVRVSLHCKGCAGKVKKYISKMKGVTSFSVDFDAKKVIVVGDVTLMEVLGIISKVRTAQLLPSEKSNATLTPLTMDAKQVV